MTPKEKLELFLTENPEMRSFQRLIDKRLEGVTSPAERHEIIFGMIESQLVALNEKQEELILLLKQMLTIN